MPKEYTRSEIINQLNAAADDMATFYQQDFINYSGTAKDIDEYYTEIVAEWCCTHIDLFDKIPQITRASSYKSDSHNGCFNAKSNRTEELIAMAMFRQGSLSLVGDVLDYQTPLKNRRNDKAGKIDLLAYDGSILRILELKKPESHETMLRCILEGYSYLRTANPEKLLADFGLPKNTLIKASPLVSVDGDQKKEMEDNRPWLKRLMCLLDSQPYYFANNGGKYIVTEV